MDPALHVARRFAENLIRARKQAGLPQEEVGFRASLHRTEAGQLERGARFARINTIVKLSGALGVEPGDLFARARLEAHRARQRRLRGRGAGVVTAMSERAFAKCFGENLVRARKRGGLSQDEVGFRAELHRTEVSQLERGLRVPRADTLVRIAAALSVDVNVLLEGIAWTPPSRNRGALTFDRPAGSGAV